MKKYLKMLIVAMVISTMLVGCTSTPVAPDGQVTPNDELDQGNSNDSGKTLIRLGVMAAADSAPIYLAEENGYFDERGLDVEIETFTNGATKQSSIQSGELDAAMVSMIQFLNNKKQGLPARITTITDGIFPVVVTPGFTEKNDVKVGLMEISVTNYLADKYLNNYNVEKIFINEMPVRLQMLLAGEIDMAVLPEPIASQAELKGAEKRVYSEAGDYTPNVIIFTQQMIDKKPEAVKAFQQGYDQAVLDINNNPSLARAILIEKLEIVPEVAELMDLPSYNTTRLPSESFVKEVEQWTANLQEEAFDLKYKDLVASEVMK